VFRCSLPSPGSLGLVPPLPQYYGALRLPAAPLTSLRFLRSVVPPLRLGLRSHTRKALRLWAWGCLPDSPLPVARRRRQDLPGSWQDPVMNVPCSSTPAEPPRSTTTALRYCLPPSRRCRLPRLLCFRGSITRPTHSLSTLRRMDCSIATQDSLPDGWPAFPGGLVARWVPTKVSGAILPPSPGFAWRTGNDRNIRPSGPACHYLVQDSIGALFTLLPFPLGGCRYWGPYRTVERLISEPQW
jgi:hypothetical protein